MSRPLALAFCFILPVAFLRAGDLSGLPPELQEAIANGSKPSTAVLDAGDPLSVARELAMLIIGDEDKACEMQFRVCKALSAAGRHADAVDFASRIRDYRSPLAQVHLARAALRSGGAHESAGGLLASAERRLDDTKPWQQELIRAALHRAGLELGWDDARLAAMLKPIKDQEVLVGAKVSALVHEACRKGTFNSEAADALLETLRGPVPELLEAAKDLHAAALTLRLKREEAATKQADMLAVQAKSLLKRAHVSYVEELLDSATALVEAGFESEAKEMFLLTEGRLGGETEQAAALHYKLARLWRLRGKSAVLPAMLEKSEQQARSQRQMDRPFALSWIAAAWREAGNGQRADQCVLDAVREAGTNVNPRMRLVGAIEICLAHAHEGRALPEPVFKVIQDISRGLRIE